MKTHRINLDQSIRLLLCPHCKSTEIRRLGQSVICQSCRKTYKIFNDKIIFSEYVLSSDKTILDKLRNIILDNIRLYEILTVIFSPIYTNNSLKKFIQLYYKSTDRIMVNLGSGNSQISNAINVDAIPYKNVNIVCDIANLPFKNESIDIIIITWVLEHVPDDDVVVSEIERVLKKGGVVYCTYPFIQGLHASPYDFTRKTEIGIKKLFKNFEIIKTENAGGPTSSLLWIFQEWIAIVFSFGIQFVHDVIFRILMFMLFPVKFLDFFLIQHTLSKHISSGFSIIARKKYA